ATIYDPHVAVAGLRPPCLDIGQRSVRRGQRQVAGQDLEHAEAAVGDISGRRAQVGVQLLFQGDVPLQAVGCAEARIETDDVVQLRRIRISGDVGSKWRGRLREDHCFAGTPGVREQRITAVRVWTPWRRLHAPQPYLQRI